MAKEWEKGNSTSETSETLAMHKVITIKNEDVGARRGVNIGLGLTCGPKNNVRPNIKNERTSNCG